MEGDNSLGRQAANLSRAVTGDLARLRFVIRFSNCPRIHDESVGEHSYYTAFYSYLIGQALLVTGVQLDLGRLLAKALMHDVDECFSGDFIRMFKHSTPELKREIDKASALFTKKLAHDLSPSTILQGMYFDDWKKAKDGLEGKIVSFADYLSVLSYVSQEIELGNIRMMRQVPELKKFHASFKDNPEYGFLKEYILQAAVILEALPEGGYERRKVQRNS